MSTPITNPRRVSVVLRDYGSKGGAYRFGKVFAAFLESRGFSVVSKGRDYSIFMPPPGARKPFRFNVDIPSRSQVEELASHFHREGTLQAVMLGDWPAIYRPAHAYELREVHMSPFTAKPIGPERSRETQVPATFRVGYTLFWDAEVTFSDSGTIYRESASARPVTEAASLFDALDSAPEETLEAEPVEELSPTEAERTDIEEDGYTPTTEDTRKAALRSIKARRGQQAFREALQHRYGGRCQISGCGLLDVLEAAHIKPYRGDNDHNPANGLLLRSDLHTLFDLDLIGIEPETLTVRVHPWARVEYESYDGRKLLHIAAEPSREALSLRWAEYLRKLPD